MNENLQPLEPIDRIRFCSAHELKSIEIGEIATQTALVKGKLTVLMWGLGIASMFLSGFCFALYKNTNTLVENSNKVENTVGKFIARAEEQQNRTRHDISTLFASIDRHESKIDDQERRIYKIEKQED